MIEHPGKVEKGEFIPADPVGHAMDIAKFNGKPVTQIIKQIFPKRSLKQNNAWHGIVVPLYMRCMGHLNHDFAHYELVKHLVPMVTIDIKGREKIGPTPTKDMDTKQSLELYRMAQDFLATEYGVNCPDPDPNWRGFAG